MPFVVLVLLVFGFVLFIVAGWGSPAPEPRWRFISYGLACWIAAEILTRGAGLSGLPK